MSKLNQIQIALKEIEGGNFQKLCDAYLKARDYGTINALGSVVGTDKTKTGTPDTFIRQKNLQLVFVEYTTQQKDVFEKFSDDLSKCLDAKKTGVPVSDISELIFCHNTNLDAGEENSLVQMAKEKGVITRVYGLDAISFDLYSKYPGVAKDFLGIEVDTGQILSPGEFITDYDKNKLATPLEIGFFYRETEITNALEFLDTNELLILAGAAGVGKSRLALEIVRKYIAKNGECHPYCITNKGQNLFEDLRVYFSRPGHFLLLVDDANRINGFNYIVDLIKNKRADQTIKVIVTVRDYAIDKIKDLVDPIGLVPELNIKRLEEDQVKSLVASIFNIKNSFWLDRIAKLSSGNPRLAIMASTNALENDGVASLNDVSALYDSYFSTVRNDILERNNKDVILVAGIISFFRTVDVTNLKLMDKIVNVFGITVERFWSSTVLLHEFELVDIYEDEVVKISDQVISTYLFYLCFFKESQISFGVIVDNFIPSSVNVIRDALYPCINAFDAETIKKSIQSPVQEKLKSALSMEDFSTVGALFRTFWFALQTDALKYIKNQIELTEQEEVDLNSLDCKLSDTDSEKSELVGLLRLFSNAKDIEFKLAIQLLLELAAKQPSLIPDIIHVLTRDFGFERRSHIWAYKRETLLLDTLIERSEKGKNEVISRIFLTTVTYLLRTEFEETEGGRHTLTIHRFNLAFTESIKAFRGKIWTTIFELLEIESLRQHALSVLSEYSSSRYYLNVEEIIKFDAQTIIPLIDKSIDLTLFENAVVIENVIDLFSELDLPELVILAQKCEHPLIEQQKLLCFGLLDIDRELISEFEAIKLSKISEYSNNYNRSDYLELLENYSRIKTLVNGRNEHALKSGLNLFFIALANRDEKLFVDIVSELLETSDIFESIVNPQSILTKLIQFTSTDEVRFLIAGDGSKDRFLWKLAYHETVPEKMCSQKDVEDLYALTANEACKHLIYDWDKYQKYSQIDSGFYVKITRIINQRVKSGTISFNPYGLLFNPYTETCKNIRHVFKDDLDLLKETYLLNNKISNHPDVDGSIMNQLLDIDSGFLREYVLDIAESKKYVSRYDISVDLDFIWKREDHNLVIMSVIELVMQLAREKEIYVDGVMCCLFKVDEYHNKTEETVIESQNHFLRSMITDDIGNYDFIELLFDAIAYFENERKLEFIALLLGINQDFELFKRISLEPGSSSWSGSAVPLLTSKRELWEGIIQMCNSIELLDHRQRCEEIILSYNQEIEREKKRDFVGW